MEEAEKRLSLDRPATYQIRVPGHLDESWSDWTRGMTITVTGEDDGPPVRWRRPDRRAPGICTSRVLGWPRGSLA
jgi:hypothetical protein